jgi:hypothetical protein
VHVLLAAVEAEQAGDAVAPQQRERIEHQVCVTGGLEHEVEAAHLGGQRSRGGLRARDIACAHRLDQLRLLRAGGATSGRPHLVIVQAQQEGREHADRAGADDEHALRRPRLPASHRPRLAETAHAHRCGLSEHPQPAQRGRHRHEVYRVLHHQLARKSIKPGDPALEVVAGVARVGCTGQAGRAVAARSAHGRGDEVAA